MKLLLSISLLAGVRANQNCAEIKICRGTSKRDPTINWTEFTATLESWPDQALLTELARRYASDSGLVRECRMGVARMFFELSKTSLKNNELQRSHNLNQLAMAMVWDVSRSHYHCLATEAIFGVHWMDEFMTEYLRLATEVSRHEDIGFFKDSAESRASETVTDRARIAVATVCEYNADHKLFGIDRISKRNREQYTRKHGYVSVFKTVNEDAPGRHPVWTAIALPLHLLESGEFDFVMWMDCDAMFIDQTRRIEDLIAGGPGKHVYISEDGRGLSGGNWIVRNTQYARSLLRRILNNPDFDEYDLRDQFGLLWSLVRPGAEMVGSELINFGYPPEVGLVPQRLINSYPWSLCRPSHHCFEDGKDFIVSFITLSSLSREMAFALLESFSEKNSDY